MNLIFNATSLSRAITRAEWKEIWRWKRLTEKRMKKSVEEQIALLVAFGTTMPKHIRSDMVDTIINPPLMIYPDPKGNYDFDLRPGAINYVR